METEFAILIRKQDGTWTLWATFGSSEANAQDELRYLTRDLGADAAIFKREWIAVA